MPDPEPTGPAGAEPDHDAAWRAIVDNYGDHPAFTEPPPPPPPPAAPSASLERLFQPWRAQEWDGDAPAGRASGPHDDDLDEDDDRFVPPPAPPLPRPEPDRLVAWIGVFGAPIVLLVCLIAQLTPPTLITYGLIGWFVGGFGYLVAKMPREPRDPWDDGAQI